MKRHVLYLPLAHKVALKKIIQLSALGVDHYPVEYAKSKKAADDFLLTLPLTGIVIRPSFVYGQGSYGGSSLFRGLAALPYLMPIPGKGDQKFQPIHSEDLSKAITHLLSPTVNKSMILTAVGPSQIRFAELLQLLRNWLGLSKAYILHIPLLFIRLCAYAGNLIPYATLNTPTLNMLLQNNIASADETELFTQTIGFSPRDFKTGLFSQPSSVQDRWHAKLYFLKPLLRVSLAFMWIMSALCSAYFYPVAQSYALLNTIGIKSFWQPLLLYGASAINAVLGLALLFNIKTKLIAQIQCLIIVLYTLIITITLPQLWLEPFGAVVKNIPILIATLILLAMESDR